MKKAHLYRLRVWFNHPDIKWDMNILAINTHCVNMWITDNQDTESFYIVKSEIMLILLDYETVKDSFLARCIANNSETLK